MTIYVQTSNEIIRSGAPIIHRFFGQPMLNLVKWLAGLGAAPTVTEILNWHKVLVCGGRDYNNKFLIHQTLDSYHKCSPIELLIHGDSTGADSIADEWAEFREIEVAAYPAAWDVHGKAAGPIRNAQMLKFEEPDLVIAFPGGSGTANMISLAKKAQVPVHEIKEFPAPQHSKLSDRKASRTPDKSVGKRTAKADSTHPKGKVRSRH